MGDEPKQPETGVTMWLWIAAFVLLIIAGAALGRMVEELTGKRGVAKLAVVGAAALGGLIYHLGRRLFRKPPEPNREGPVPGE